MLMIQYIQRYGLPVLVILFLAALGISLFASSPGWVLLVLLPVSAWLVWFHHLHRQALWPFALLAFVVGWVAEALAVHGLFPGQAVFDHQLGPQTAGVPLLAGVNWFLAAYGAAALADKLFFTAGFRIFASAFLMLALAFVMEPVWGKLGIKHWPEANAGWGTYAVWLGAGTVLQIILHRKYHQVNNPTALGFFAVQLVFYSILNFFL